jgi:hypothetical protein
MSEMFEIEAADLINLRKFFKRAPREFRRTQASVLNSFAFGTRTESLDVIFEKMTIRDSRFAKSSMRVEKARSKRLESRAGSLNRARFTGWAEQQTGEKPDRGRVATVLARGSNERNRIRPGFRMKPSSNFMSPGDFQGKTDEHRVTVMLQTISRDKIRKPFVIRKSRKWGKGLYKLHGNKIKRLQSFEPKYDKVRRIPWMSAARRRYFRANRPRDVWAKSIRHVLKLK